MPELKAGQRFKSSVCEIQVMIIKGTSGDHALSCGGAPMIAVNAAASGILDPQKADGTVIGKHYVNADETIEVLCVKAGIGSLYWGGTKLLAKQAKALPSSD